MRPHSLLIAIGGFGLTMAGTGLLAHGLQWQDEQRLAQQSLQVSQRLCRALEMSSLLLQDSSQPTPSLSAPMRWHLSRPLGLLELSPQSSSIAAPERSVGARPAPQAARAASPLCTDATFLQVLRLSADPASDARLLVSLHRPGSRRSSSLLLDGHALWPRQGGPPPFRITATASAASATDHRAYALPGHPTGLELRTQRDESGNLPLRLGLPLALALLGIGLTGLLVVWMNRRRGAMEPRRQLSSDYQTGLPTLSRLELDLQNLSRDPAVATETAGLLVTIHFQVLERQRAFLTDSQLGELLLSCCSTIREYRPYWPNLQAYRISESRLAILTPPLPDPCLSDARHSGERLLQELLNDAREATVKTLGLALQWDDIVVTGQSLGAKEPCCDLLVNHAFGERLAGEDRVAYRMLDESDERRGRTDSAIAHALLALAPGDLEFVFQPILLLSDPGRFGLELLLRFRPEELRKAGTGEVMRLAHKLDVAHRVDDLVLSQLPEIHEWLRNDATINSKISYISVNITSNSVSTPKNVDKLIHLLRRYEVDNSLFALEITETAATNQLAGSAHLKTASERLSQELAFRIYIDDFGSGLSNYRRICEAWYDVIKLDIGLIKGISDSFRLQHYVGSFIKSVHALGKMVVAEGIEDSSDLATAIRLGTDCIQGFRISRPLPRDDLQRFLSSSEWACPDWLGGFLREIRDSDKLLLPDHSGSGKKLSQRIPLERQLLENWSQLRSYEEFVLLFVNDLRQWGLDLMRLSLAFLPEEEDIDCSQYIWTSRLPGEVRTLRMERDFLEHSEHRSSPLHRIATTGETMRRHLDQIDEPEFQLFTVLKDQGCSDYLGIRLESRGISVPVLTLALQHGCVFSDEHIQRIESMSSLLSLLFYTFESERAKRLALLDPLTGLANRRSFDSFLRANIASCKANAQPLALALIDIDRFKVVNDLMGHAYGDRALRKVATTLNSQLLRRSDFLARLGGEEFGLIMPDTDAARARELCNNMRQAIEACAIEHPEAGSGGVLTISIGVSLWRPQDGESCDSDSLQQLADESLYAAKRTGRNRVESVAYRESDRPHPRHP
ncbi:MAG: GGDEF domain-containing protein [Synechococcaceae cyanobacterium]|nr:GGDEF domain-containing protein [Synechococcaceae cyanobacterium]